MLNVFVLNAKQGGEHFNDMLYIFPFSTDSRNFAVIDLYHHINSYIDEPNWVETSSKKPSCIYNDKVFSQKIRVKNHRIYYHWGLSEPRYSSKSLARKFRPLQSVVERQLENEDDKRRFWANLCNEEHKRLQEVYHKAINAFGYNTNKIYQVQHQQIWSLVTILYCIHVLGDHTTTLYDIIREEKELREDVYRSIRTLAGGYNKSEANKLISFLEKEAPLNESGRGTMDCSAQKFLEAMKDKKNGFSQFILSCDGPGYNFRQRFAKAGRITQ